ncbi:hypothetical protein D3C81_747070 [compost metagenome]
MLKETSPVRKDGVSRGYAKSWKRKKTKSGYVIYNEKHYRLTHLLEHGHVKRNGGRAAARVHIRPVEEKIVEQFGKRVEKVIKG